MGKIVAIGGGEIRDLDTLLLDKEIVRLTGKKHPRALFIPTASGDSEGYWLAFQKVYGDMLGCTTEVLFLLRQNQKKKDIEKKILEADLIYVGGGNTLKMLKLWRKTGVDELLIRAYRRGTVLSGLSAGAICWFRYGCSDSRRFSNPTNNSYMRVSGLDLVNLTISPHHIREVGRDNGLAKLMQRTSGVAIALDDNCAIEIIDGKYRIISARKGVRAKKVYCKNKAIRLDHLDVSEGYTPISRLLEK
jgi:dipeptidase E